MSNEETSIEIAVPAPGNFILKEKISYDGNFFEIRYLDPIAGAEHTQMVEGRDFKESILKSAREVAIRHIFGLYMFQLVNDNIITIQFISL